MRIAVIASSFMLFLAACATAQGDREGQSGRVEFALIGDVPYNARHEKEFANVMKRLNEADLAFVVHNGDFWWDGAAWTEKAGGFPPCSDEVFQDRLGLAQSSRHPFIFVPGDNEWADCHRAKPRTYDPFERLTKLRQMFFAGDQSLGRRTIRLTRQSEDTRYAKFRENVRWIYGNVLFVTLHVIGSNNNLGRTPEMDAEYSERTAANLAWMRQAFDLAMRDANRAIMIIAQANPRFETSWPPDMQQRYMLAGLGFKSPETRRATGFDEFLAALEKETVAFGKPVFYVHGDSHLFRVDKPLVGSRSRRIIENFTRVETFGYPYTHWVRGIIDPRDPKVFSFREEIVEENLVKH
ncbi:MAG TPA: hypothetical protein VLG10_15330 [Methylomirabilota bacterium]|nr:hypothetical protein [Methylomirabilota bacterium]